MPKRYQLGMTPRFPVSRIRNVLHFACVVDVLFNNLLHSIVFSMVVISSMPVIFKLVTFLANAMYMHRVHLKMYRNVEGSHSKYAFLFGKHWDPKADRAT